MPISPDLFRKVLGHFATGVTVVTMRRPSGQPWGFTVNAFSSVSLTPPLILVCVDHRAESFQAMNESSHFAVNFLTQEQEEIASRFASKLPDRFNGVVTFDPKHGHTRLACRKWSTIRGCKAAVIREYTNENEQAIAP